MTDWTSLRHAYGDASDVPGLLGQVVPDPKAEVWDALWSRLCHQGSVYSASFAALPFLLEHARQWPATHRAMVLSLAGAILVSDDVAGSRQEFTAGLDGTIRDLEQLGLQSLAAGGLTAEDFIYVAQSVLALRGDALWGDQLDRLASGEFEGVCPRCQIDLFLVIGQYGFFVAAEEWVNRPNAKRLPIAIAAPSALEGVGRWLHDHALAAGQAVVAEWARYLFGTTTCPGCGEHLSVVGCIERASSPTRVSGLLRQEGSDGES
jgi:hypothetical protein